LSFIDLLVDLCILSVEILLTYLGRGFLAGLVTQCFLCFCVAFCFENQKVFLLSVNYFFSFLFFFFVFKNSWFLNILFYFLLLWDFWLSYLLSAHFFCDLFIYYKLLIFILRLDDFHVFSLYVIILKSRWNYCILWGKRSTVFFFNNFIYSFFFFFIRI
jgi:hypothetical protein